MSGTVVIDMDPLATFFDRDAKHHEWIREQMKRLAAGLVTCEDVGKCHDITLIDYFSMTILFP